MLGLTRGNIFYKFKSEKKFRELNYELPTLVSHIRIKLRDILDIGEDMEILVTPSDKNGRVSNVYLSDYELIKDGTYLNAVRLPKELAKPLYEAANSRIKNKQLSSTIHMNAISKNNLNSLTNHINSDRSEQSFSSTVNITSSSTALDSKLDANSSSNVHLESPLLNNLRASVNTNVNNSSELKTDCRENIINTSTKDRSNSSEDAAILSVMQQHGEKFKQTAAQRSEILEQLNQRGSLRSASTTGSRYNSNNVSNISYLNAGSYRSEPYKKVLSNNISNCNVNYHSSGATSASSSINYGYKNNPNSGSTDVPADYICHMCGERGHHIRVCPKVNEGVSQKKIRPATGIPRSFLRAINFDEEGRLYSEVYCLPDGTFAVLKDAKQLSSTAFLTRTVEDTIGKHMGKSKEDTGLVRNSLTCPICTRLFRYAVLTPCCGETYCQECIINFIRNHTDASGISPNTIKGLCPHCSTVISIADLEPNNPIRKSVNVALGLQPN